MKSNASLAYCKPVLRDLGRMSSVTRKSGGNQDNQTHPTRWN